jgi:Arc/MetJ-type ribon-helix-helix transcriptional regulator
MKRTTVLLPEELHKRLRQEASRRGLSVAELIRSRLERTQGHKRRTRASDPLANVEGTVHDGKLSAGIDEALYRN